MHPLAPLSWLVEAYLGTQTWETEKQTAKSLSGKVSCCRDRRSREALGGEGLPSWFRGFSVSVEG